MRILAAILIVLMTGEYYAEANEKGDRTVLGSLASLEEGSKSRYTRDNGEDIRFGGNILRSFRRTAARLQEYDGLNPNGEFGREGLNWTRGPIASRQASETQGRAKTETRTEERWGWSQDKIIIPEAARNYMLFFTLKGCGPCQIMYPIIKDLQDQGYEIYIVYQRTNKVMVNQHQVTNYPTMVIYNDEDQVKRLRGIVSIGSIVKYLQKPTPPNNPDRARYDFVDGPSKYKLW